MIGHEESIFHYAETVDFNDTEDKLVIYINGKSVLVGYLMPDPVYTYTYIYIYILGPWISSCWIFMESNVFFIFKN